MPLPKNYNFRPLPIGISLEDSKIHGKGCIATLPIAKDYIFTDHATHFVIDGKIERSSFGGWINHSDDNNSELIKVDDRYFLRAIKDIGFGEELTLNYNNELCGDSLCCKDEADIEEDEDYIPRFIRSLHRCPRRREP